MKLLLHQFRFDLRRLRPLLLFWWALLGLDIIVSLGWLGSPAEPRDNLRQVIYSMVPPALAGALVCVMIQLIAMLMLADSPAHPEGFMATRPLPWRTWLGAKAIFIAVCLALPAVFQELLHLALAGLPARYVLHGALERLLYVLPICAIAVGVAAQAQRLKEIVTLFLAALGITYLTGLALALISEFWLRWRVVDDTYMGTRLLVFLYVLAAGLVVAVPLAKRLRWRRKLRHMVVSGASMLALAAGAFWSKDLFPPAAAATEKSAPLEQQVAFRVPARSLQLQTVADRGHPNRISVQARVEAETALTNVVIRWEAASARFAGANGTYLAERRTRKFGTHEVFQYVYNYAPDEVQILARLAPPGTRVEMDISGMLGQQSCWIGNFNLPAPVERLEEKVRMHADFTGRVFQWEMAGELDLMAGARSRDGFGEWRIAGLGEPGVPGQMVVRLERRQISLATTRDQRAQTSRYWPADRYDFVVYDPARETLQTLQHRGVWGNAWFGHTAYTTHGMSLTFRDSQPQVELRSGVINDHGPLDPPRLLIFRRVYLGTLRRSWTSPELVLAEVVRPTANYSAARGQMTRAEFLHLAAKLAAPDPARAMASDVRRYIAECGRLIRSANRQHERDNRLILSLAAYVPAHLPVFLEALERESTYYGQWLRAAVEQGAEAAQRQAIIAALRRNPDLAEIVANRGWLEEARTELLALVETPRTLPYSCWRAAAWFAEPKTYPLFLEQLEQSPDAWFYDLVRALPGIEPELDRVVDRMVRRMPLGLPADAGEVARTSVVASDGGWALRAYPGLEVALRHGRPEALGLALQLLQARSGEPRNPPYEVMEMLRRNVAMDAIKRDRLWDDKLVFQLLSAHKAEEFQFDEVRRNFVLSR